MPRDSSDDMDLALGLAIRLKRQELGISQSDLGEAIGLSFQQVQKYERGLNRVSFSVLARIAGALSCSLDELVSEVVRIRGGGALARREALTQPEAPAILLALSEIKAPAVRRALLDFTRSLAHEVKAQA